MSGQRWCCERCKGSWEETCTGDGPNDTQAGRCIIDAHCDGHGTVSGMEHKKVDLEINTETVRQILSGFIHSEITRAGFGRAVVNLSGGLDSTLSCYLAAQAMGAENVLALRLPYESSSPDSLEHAQMVIQALGVPSLTIPITDMVDGLVRQFPDMSQIRQGNV